MWCTDKAFLMLAGLTAGAAEMLAVALGICFLGQRTSFKLLEGDDTGTITLPKQGSMPIKVPNYKSFCITHFEAEKLYECLDSDNVVSPIVFSKDFQPPIEEVRPEYQLLEEFLDNGKTC